MAYNKNAIIVKNMLDKVREHHELTKFIVYSQDDSEGSRLLMKDTDKIGFFRARYLNPDALSLRRSMFGGRDK